MNGTTHPRPRAGAGPTHGRSWRAAASVLAAAALVLAPRSARADEPPAAAPKPADVLALAADLEHEDPSARAAAARALAALGLAATPACLPLGRALSDPAFEVRSAAADALGELGAVAVPTLLDALRGPSARARRAAERGLARLGPDDVAATPLLLQAVSDRALRTAALRALIRLGPPLEASLALARGESDTFEERAAATRKLGAAALSAALRALRSEDWPTVRAGLGSIAMLGEAAAPAVPELMALAEDPEFRHPGVALEALHGLGPLAAPVVDRLIAMARTGRDEWIRGGASRAIHACGAAAVPALLRAAARPQPAERAAAAGLLGELLPALQAEGASVVDALAGLARADPAAQVRIAALACASADVPAPAALEALIAALGDSDVEVEAAACYVATHCARELRAHADASAAEAALIAVLSEERADPELSRAREHAAVVLRRFSSSEAVREALHAVLARPLPGASRELVIAATEALAEHADERPRVVAALLRSVGHPDAEVREAVVWGLWRLVEDHPELAREALPALAQALADPVDSVRLHAAEALTTAAPYCSDQAVPALVRATADPDWYVRAVVAETLGVVGPAAVEAVPALVGLLRDPSGEVRQTAAAALPFVGPAALHAIPALTAALDDANEQARTACRDALLQLGGLDRRTVAAAAAELLSDAQRAPAARAEACLILAALGGDAAPTLVAALGDRAGQVRAGAVAGLGLLATGDAVPYLARALSDPEPEVRARAASALQRLGPRAAGQVEALAAALSDPLLDVRRSAVSAIAAVGSVAHPAVLDALARALREDPSPKLRAGAAAALAAVVRGPLPYEAAAPLVETVLAALQDGAAAAAAATTLGALNAHVAAHLARQGAATALAAALDRVDPRVREAAARALGELGPAASVAAPALAGLIADPGEQTQIRQAATEALERVDPARLAALLARLAVETPSRSQARLDAVSIMLKAGASPDQALPLILPVFEAEDDVLRYGAVDLLTQVGLPATEALTAALGDSSAGVRAKAARALGEFAERLSPERRAAALAALTATLRAALASGPLYGVGSAAAQALARFGPDAAPAAPLLAEAIPRGRAELDYDLIRAGINTLGAIGPPAAEVGVAALLDVLAITEIFDTEDFAAMTEAADALGRLGDASPRVIEALVRALARGDGEGLAGAAAQALGRLGGRAPDLAVPALLRAYEAGRPSRRVTTWALGRIGPAAATALPALLPALEGAPQDAAWAAHAVLRIDPARRDVVEVTLTRVIGDLPPAVGLVAAEDLRRLGPGPARLALDYLCGLLAQAQRASDRARAARALAAFGAAAAPALERASESDPQPEVREAAAAALNELR